MKKDKLIILSGSIGVGKSSFIEKHQPNKDLYQSKPNIKDIMKKVYMTASLTPREESSLYDFKVKNILNYKKLYMDRGPLDIATFGMLWAIYYNKKNMKKTCLGLIKKALKLLTELQKTKDISVLLFSADWDVVHDRIVKRNRFEEINGDWGFIHFLNQHYPIFISLLYLRANIVVRLVNTTNLKKGSIE